MRQIGNAQGYGPLYDSPGGTGGRAMVRLTVDADGNYREARLGEPALGWARNPQYGITAGTGKAAP